MVTETIDLKNNMAKVLLKILIFTCVITNTIVLKYDSLYLRYLNHVGIILLKYCYCLCFKHSINLINS